MIGYLVGFFKYLCYPRISFLSIIERHCDINKRTSINRGTKIYKSQIGKYTYIAKSCDISYATIGCYCSVGNNCKIGLASHTVENISTSPIFTLCNNGTGYTWINKSTDEPNKRVEIGNDVWIGDNALVLGGLSIGDGAVVGAGACVTKNVPPYAIVGGVPAKIIRYRFSPETIKKLLIMRWWNVPEQKLKRNIHYFQVSRITINQLAELEVLFEK